ncbi:metal-dependent transcriptional regulator [Bilifractor sp. LCP19S3_H10]|uniref:metal-dependent transcriptional regulator n=1 Tax=unclassified Bilifractor TaxID=2815795 RepID=UPI003F894887|nr:metal-dependent transcriptional regulator [Eubacterium sp.]
MTIQKSAEDYLEAMLMMKEQHGYIRSIDIADHLGVTKPSVSYATKRLRENGFITMDHSGFITLTDSGMEIADRIYSRHKMLTDFFTAIGVSPEIARTDACKVEHDISEETFKAMSRYNEILKETQNKAAAES